MRLPRFARNDTEMRLARFARNDTRMRLLRFTCNDTGMRLLRFARNIKRNSLFKGRNSSFNNKAQPVENS